MDLYLVSLLTILAIAAISAFLAVESRELMHGVFFLGVFLVTMGAIYFLLGAEFIGVVQILLYAGGVVVLLIFALMLLPRRGEREVIYRGPGTGIVMIFLVLFFLMLGKSSPPSGAVRVPTSLLAETVLSQYLLLEYSKGLSSLAKGLYPLFRPGAVKF